jgi:hypothetical protein
MGLIVQAADTFVEQSGRVAAIGFDRGGAGPPPRRGAALI